MQPKRAIVKCLDYNGHKDVLFMMKEDDSRFDTENYPVITAGIFDPRTMMFGGDDGNFYQIFGDWSAKKIVKEIKLENQN